MDWDPPETWHKLAEWLRSLGASLGAKPKAVVVISGHWEEPEFTITSHPRPPLIYDYFGFPEHTYKIEYPAPGSPELAERIRELLRERGIPARSEHQRGFDHGVFIPFKLIYPEADVPIVQLSLKGGLDPEVHLSAGSALEPLRREGVLIAGSGMSYHNLQGFFGGAGKRADSFDSWLTDAVGQPAARRTALLRNWPQAPAAREAHPREEHLIPLLVAAGAAGEDAGKLAFHDRIMDAPISAYRFG
jgi:aromatic ring-opening dioxygenase catalytic subunit (LigB family)